MERIFLYEPELPRVNFTEDVVSGAVKVANEMSGVSETSTANQQLLLEIYLAIYPYLCWDAVTKSSPNTPKGPEAWGSGTTDPVASLQA
jgi:hypothetical protein